MKNTFAALGGMSTKILVRVVFVAICTLGCSLFPCIVLADDSYLSKRHRVDARFHTQLNWLAGKCDELGLGEQAKATRDWIIPRDPRRQYLFVPPRDDPMAPEADAEKIVRYWYDKLTAFRQEQADHIFRLAKDSADDGHATRAYQLLHEVIRENPNHQKAREILGYRMVNEQWRKPSSVIRARRMRIANRELGFAAGEYWLVESQNFSIRTDLSEQAGLALAEQLEELRDVWQQLFFRYWSNSTSLSRKFSGSNPVSRTLKRHKVVLFRDRAEYLARLQPIEPMIKVTVGIYLEPKRTAYFYGDGDEDIWQHEVTHQLFSETGRVTPGVGANSDFWIVEGVALYMESLQRWDGYYTVGGVDAKRLQFARYRALAEAFYVPLHELTVLGRQNLQQHPEIRRLYSQSAGLSSFLMDYRNGVYRRGLVDYLKSIYQDDHGSPDVAAAVGEKLENLDRQYIEFLNVTDNDLAYLAQMPTAESLALANTQVTDAGLKNLQGHKRLRWVDLSNTKTTDTGVAFLSNAKEMDHLSLERTGITDACLTSVSGMTNLNILDLSRCQITDTALPHIAKFTNLTELWLGGTRVTDQGLAHLKHLRELETLDINGTGVTREGWNRLREELPNLTDD